MCEALQNKLEVQLNICNSLEPLFRTKKHKHLHNVSHLCDEDRLLDPFIKILAQNTSTGHFKSRIFWSDQSEHRNIN
jgi:hypothetical protein